MTNDTFEKSIVALACWDAAKGEQLNGMLAVGSCLNNRAKAGWFNSSIYDNAVALCVENRINQFPDVREPSFQNLLQLIDGIETRFDLTNGGLWFCSAKEEKDTSKTTFTGQVGQLQFFK